GGLVKGSGTEDRLLNPDPADAGNDEVDIDACGDINVNDSENKRHIPLHHLSLRIGGCGLGIPIIELAHLEVLQPNRYQDKSRVGEGGGHRVVPEHLVGQIYPESIDLSGTLDQIRVQLRIGSDIAGESTQSLVTNTVRSARCGEWLTPCNGVSEALDNSIQDDEYRKLRHHRQASAGRIGAVLFVELHHLFVEGYPVPLVFLVQV